MNTKRKWILVVGFLAVMIAVQIVWHIALLYDTPFARLILNLYLNMAEADNPHRKHDIALMLDLVMPSVVTLAFCGALAIPRGKSSVIRLSILISLTFMVAQFAYTTVLPHKLWWFNDGTIRIIKESAFQMIYVPLLSLIGFNVAFTLKTEISARRSGQHPESPRRGGPVQRA